MRQSLKRWLSKVLPKSFLVTLGFFFASETIAYSGEMAIVESGTYSAFKNQRKSTADIFG
jgi:hypothetical protein